MWTQMFGSSSHDSVNSVSAADGSVYIAGYTKGNLDELIVDSDVFLAKVHRWDAC